MKSFPTREQMLELIEEHAPDSLKQDFAKHLQPSVAVLTTASSDAEIVCGASKIGGAPDVPTDFEWPTWKGEPLGFLAQFDLSQVAPFDLRHELPSEGLLSFFYAIEKQPWGFEKEHAGSWKVFYWPKNVTLSRSSLPENIVERNSLPTCAVDLAVEWVLPELSSAEMFGVELDEGEEDGDSDQDLYYDFLDILAKNRPDVCQHRLLGFASSVQDDAPYSCFRNASGAKPKDDETSIEYYRRVQPEVSQWRLLFQLDSQFDRADGSKGWMWGDVGLIYFCLREDDLKNRRFADVWLDLQCG